MLDPSMYTSSEESSKLNKENESKAGRSINFIFGARIIIYNYVTSCINIKSESAVPKQLLAMSTYCLNIFLAGKVDGDKLLAYFIISYKIV